MAPAVAPAVALAPLLEGSERALSQLAQQLRSRGWCFLDLAGTEFASAAERVAAASADFLARSSPGAVGDPVRLEGMHSSAHRAGVRLITGDFLQRGPARDACIAGGVPAAAAAALWELGAAADAASVRVARGLSTLGLLTSGFDSELPLLRAAGQGAPRYGMLDLVRYRNGPACPETVVAAHTDPGLFVLSAGSTAEGLELWDEHGQWQSVPPAQGVLWCGDHATAASGWAIPAAWHRVMRGPSPRLAVWHEMCTAAQIAPPMLDGLQEQGLELRMGELRGTDAVISALCAAEQYRGTGITRGGITVAPRQPPALNAAPAPADGNAQSAEAELWPLPFGIPMGKAAVQPAQLAAPVPNGQAPVSWPAAGIPAGKSAARMARLRLQARSNSQPERRNSQ